MSYPVQVRLVMVPIIPSWQAGMAVLMQLAGKRVNWLGMGCLTRLCNRLKILAHLLGGECDLNKVIKHAWSLRRACADVSRHS